MPRFSWPKLVCGIALSASTTALAADDVDAIAATAGVIQAGYASQSPEIETEYVESFTSLIVQNAQKIARREGILRAGKVGTEAFTSFVRENVEGVIPPAARNDSARERKKALNTALIAMSTQSYAETVLSEWLNLPAPAEASAGLGPRASTQLTLGSSDGRLKMHLDEEARFQDLGGPGSQNGVADAGEWVKLTLGVYNASKTPFVSSSAWVTVDSSSCGWTFPDEEILLPEMSPHDPEAELPKSEMGQINSWIYLSEECAHNSRVPLRFSIKDTHEASSAIVLTARIEVTTRGVSRVRDYLVDSDIPGFSEGADPETLQIVPDLRFELSHGLNTGPGQIMGAQMAWGMAELSQAMMSDQSYRAEQPMVLEGSTLAFGDDLDLETHAKPDTLHTAIDNMGKEWKWSTVDDARLWLLTDTTVSYKSMDPPEAMVEEIPDEICDNYLDDDDDGKHDCEDSDCAEADVCQAPPQALGINQILELVKENAAIAASPAKPEIDGAISAVDPNYELVFDQEEFALRYGCMVNGL
ncbi:MAG: hypothetical protein VXW32_09715, partial [Myxococcota bacterium]|nr:hypothetical protein [Myxococcota bacterium]